MPESQGVSLHASSVEFEIALRSGIPVGICACLTVPRSCVFPATQTYPRLCFTELGVVPGQSPSKGSVTQLTWGVPIATDSCGESQSLISTARTWRCPTAACTLVCPQPSPCPAYSPSMEHCLGNMDA